MLERLKLTSDPLYANASLAQARDDDELLWPDVAYFTGQHPVMEWVGDKLLQRVGRNEALALRAKVESPTFIVQGLYSNKAGQATVVEWMAIDRLDGPNAQVRVRDLQDALREAGVGPRMANPGWDDNDNDNDNDGDADNDIGLRAAQKLLALAVEAGRTHVHQMRQVRSQTMLDTVKRYQRRLDRWKEASFDVAQQIALVGPRDKRVKQIEHTAKTQGGLIERLASEGAPLVRVLAVILP